MKSKRIAIYLTTNASCAKVHNMVEGNDGSRNTLTRRDAIIGGIGIIAGGHIYKSSKNLVPKRLGDRPQLAIKGIGALTIGGGVGIIARTGYNRVLNSLEGMRSQKSVSTFDEFYNELPRGADIKVNAYIINTEIDLKDKSHSAIEGVLQVITNNEATVEYRKILSIFEPGIKKSTKDLIDRDELRAVITLNNQLERIQLTKSIQSVLKLQGKRLSPEQIEEYKTNARVRGIRTLDEEEIIATQDYIKEKKAEL